MSVICCSCYLHHSASHRPSSHEQSLECPRHNTQYPSSSSDHPCRTPTNIDSKICSLQVLQKSLVNAHRGRTYIAQNLIGLAGTNGVFLVRMASPLVQVGSIDDITQHVLAPLGNLVADGVWWDVGLNLILMVVLMVKPLLRYT